MRCLTILAFLLTSFLHAEPPHNAQPQQESHGAVPAKNPLYDLEGEPSIFVKGVNVFSGDYIDTEVDMELPGVEPFFWQRSFHHDHDGDVCAHQLGLLGHGWNLDCESKLCVCTGCKGILTQNLSTLKFNNYSKNHPNILPSSEYEKVVTNTTSGILSGRTDIKNTRMIWNGPRNLWQIWDGSGIVKSYSGNRINDEVRPSGNRILYTYDHNKLKEVKFTNSVGKNLGSYTVQKGDHRIDIFTNDGRSIYYQFDKFYQITAVERPEQPPLRYTYCNTCYKMRGKFLPNHRYQQMNYKEDPFAEGIDRVLNITEPVGADSTPVVTYTFEYGWNKTTVKDVNSVVTCYYKNQQDRLSRIDKWDKNNNIYYRDQLYWKGHQLAARCIRPHADQILRARTYTYDERGNVLVEKLYGNLSGVNQVHPQLSTTGEGISNGCECYVKNYTYTNDGLNLLHHETDGRNEVLYIYCPGNDMLSGKISTGEGQTYKREFFEYNSDLAVTKRVIDNGTTVNQHDLTGVTEKHIFRYIPRTEYPVGLPEVEEESCLDLSTGAEILISRKVNQYTSFGKLASQIHYDNQGLAVYTLHWTYDPHGNVLESTDPLGRVTQCKYDDNDNLIYEKKPDHHWWRELSYDYMNRLIKEEEVHPDGRRFSTSHRYDRAGNLIATVDYFGHETSYKYDEFNRLIETVEPAVLDQFGNLYHPITKAQYDCVGNQEVTTDARGISTTKYYTARNQPYYVAHPDGTVELNIYNLNGTINKKVKRDRTYSLMSYDFANRPIKEEFYDAEDRLLQTTSVNYDTFHKITETDSAGKTTFYEYTPEGYVKRVVKEDSDIRLVYDSLGRNTKTIHVYGSRAEDVAIRGKKYDLLNRVIEETNEDYAGNILTRTEYGYDEVGNQNLIIQYYEDGRCAVTSKVFNSHHDPILVVDPEGHQTVMTREFNYHNEHGQHVEYLVSTDPHGTSTGVAYDTHGRVALTAIYSPQGYHLLRKQERRYDGAGNLMTVTNLNMNKYTTTFYEYNGMNQLERMVEAWGLPEQRTTTLRYCAQGQKSHHIKPDGVELLYSYDSYGHLTGFNASDQSFSYIYEYNANHQPVLIRDLIHNTMTQKIYDISGRLEKEILANGLSLSYTYDRMSRPLSVTLPDQTTIQYHYDASQLKKVTYEEYSHEYLAFDQADNVTSSKLIGNAGTASFTFDLLGRKRETFHDKWSEVLDQFDELGNLLRKTIHDSFGNLESVFSFDFMSQLTTEDGGASHAYQYDCLGNCISKDGIEQQFNVFNMQLNDASHDFSYDANGNLTARPPEVFSYDALNRLICHEEGDVQTRYVYDEKNRRQEKSRYVKRGDDWEKEDTTRFIYQGKNEIGACDAQGRITELRVLGLGQESEIGAAVAIKVGEKIYAPLHDHTGSVACLIDAKTGQVAESYRYSAFGQQLFSSAIIPWLYASKRFDPETELIYFGMRYYDPQTSRWISTDPIGTQDGPNLYTYLHNCPLTHFDAYGLFSLSGWFSSDPNRLSPRDQILQRRQERQRQQMSGNDGAQRRREPHYGRYGNREVPLGYRGEITKVVTVGTVDTTHLGYENGYQNGMMNSLEFAIQNATYLSEKYGGEKVTLVYNPTSGFLLIDVLRVLVSKFTGNPTKAAISLRHYVNQRLHEVPGLKMHLSNHSEGCLNARNGLSTLPQEVRDRTSILGIAPAAYIDDSLFKRVVHLVSDHDPIRYCDFNGARKFAHTIIKIPKHKNASRFDHALQSPTLEENIINNYETLKENNK